MPFKSLGLSAEIVRAVIDNGYHKATPIQRQAIPIILEGRDIMAGAQTGTGKTAAFALPLLQRLSEKSPHKTRGRIRALILTPTRELAAQVYDSVCSYARHLPLKSAVIYGGVSLYHQIKKLDQYVDIVVATPGRLLDHARQKNIDLSQVEILVLDEADRMLDMGFINDIRKIISFLPRQRQSLLFFATFSDEIKQLANSLLKSPVLIEVARRNTASEQVKQTIHPVDQERKRELLSFLIGSNNWKQVLVFTRTKHGANRLTKKLESDGLSTLAIHGDKKQGARIRALEQFKKGLVRVLVATDVASRGLDIDQLPHVINYELPHSPEDYVHRIGRTGRAGQEGEAISLVSADEIKLLKEIERLLKTTIPQIIVSGYEPNSSMASKLLCKKHLIQHSKKENLELEGRFSPKLMQENRERNNERSEPSRGGRRRRTSKSKSSGSHHQQFAQRSDQSRKNRNKRSRDR